MVLNTLTSVTPNGVGLVTAVTGLIFPQSAHKHTCQWDPSSESPGKPLKVNGRELPP